jgi:hypothetical protein
MLGNIPAVKRLAILSSSRRDKLIVDQATEAVRSDGQSGAPECRERDVTKDLQIPD